MHDGGWILIFSPNVIEESLPLLDMNAITLVFTFYILNHVI